MKCAGTARRRAFRRPARRARRSGAGPPSAAGRGSRRCRRCRRCPADRRGRRNTLPPLEYRRLGALGVGILVIVLVLVLLARGCSGSSAKSDNENYVSALTTTVLKPSDDVAKQFHEMLDLPAASLAIIHKRLDGQLAAMRTVKAHAARRSSRPSSSRRTRPPCCRRSSSASPAWSACPSASPRRGS